MKDFENAKLIMTQALKMLNKAKTVKLLLPCVKFLYTEREYDRARDLGEVIIYLLFIQNVIQFDPKRWETWNLLIEWEVKSGNDEDARRLFERAVSVKFSNRNMKNLFTKYLQFEAEHKDEDVFIIIIIIL